MKKILIIILAICFSAFILINTFNSLALDANYYASNFKSLSDYKTDDDTYNLLAIKIVDYLDGRSETLQTEIMVDGKPMPFFNEKELLHMEDVRNLIAAEKKVSYGIFGLLLLLLLIMGRDTISIGFSLILSPILNAALALLAINLDFTSGFITFHEIFFTNDLYLLDPATDRLINLMPEPFFIGFLFDWVTLVVIIGAISILIGFISVYRNKDRISEIFPSKKVNQSSNSPEEI